MVVPRAQLNCLDADTYAQCFKTIFHNAGKDHTTFKIGKSLIGMIADWSDQQAKDLEKAIGEPLALEMLEGC